MRAVGHAYWGYRRYLHPHLPTRLQSAMSRFGAGMASQLAQRIHAEYAFWRVKKSFTHTLGPQYRRSRTYLDIDITYACNLNCYNCNRSCEQAPTGEHVSVAQIKRVIDEWVAADYRWKRIRLLGGEPTVHKDFSVILHLLREYRDRWSPTTILEVITNGHGEKVQRAIAMIPDDVRVDNTSKETRVQPHFGSFNVAPIDTREYRDADFGNGCWVIENCGTGLGPNGYYVCSVASGIDRIFGWDVGRRHLPLVTDDMVDHLERFCSHCGHFKRRPEPPLVRPLMSKVWTEAYARYRARRPNLTRYGGEDRPDEMLEPQDGSVVPHES
jgi:hypothetical protein